MRFSTRLKLTGFLTIPLGIALFAVSFTNGQINEVITGGVWKGPLLAIAGAGALYYGIKLSKV